ncbi:MAG: helix-turn-helix domain-containing protein [Bacteroidales bacterium]|nr:helix-turn-helix domain-containing protein [Bacteroidales bacterium]
MNNKAKDCKCLECSFKSIPVSLLAENELNTLCSNCIQIEFKAGENIIKQGGFTTNIAYMTKGLAKIHMEGPLKKEEIIKIVKSPSFIGVPSVFTGRVFHYSVTSLTETSVCFIDYPYFEKLLLSNGEFAKELIKELSFDLVQQFKTGVNKSQKRVNAYVAEVLLDFSENIFDDQNFQLPLSRNEFAYLVGSSRETVTRILHDFTEEGLINVNGKSFKILNSELLHKISET